MHSGMIHPLHKRLSQENRTRLSYAQLATQSAIAWGVEAIVLWVQVWVWAS